MLLTFVFPIVFGLRNSDWSSAAQHSHLTIHFSLSAFKVKSCIEQLDWVLASNFLHAKRS